MSPDGDLDLGADRFAERRVEAGEIFGRVRRLHRDLADPVVGVAIDRKAGAVRTAIAELRQHVGKHRAELRLKRLVLQEESDDAAHVRPRSNWHGT